MSNALPLPRTPLARRRVWVERGVMAAVALASLLWTGWWLRDLAQSPLGAELVERAESELLAAYERGLAREATPAAIEARLAARLDESPRDWVVIDALVDLAAGQGIALSPALLTRHATLNAEDNGWIATGVDCARCAWDLGLCDLNAALACGVAINLTPLGDVAALVREGGNYVAGDAVDQVDVGIAFVGLAATGLVLVSGGSSLTVKGGAALLRVAHRTGRLAPDLLVPFRRAFALGVDWGRLPGVRSADDLAALGRPAVLRPALALAQDLGGLTNRLGTRQALHLTGALQSPAEVARAARAAEGLGPRTLGTFEMVGKSRFLLLGMRLSDEVWAALAGVFAALGSLAGLVAPLVARAGRGALRLGLRLTLRLAIR